MTATLAARRAAQRKMILSVACFHGVGIRLGGLIQLICSLSVRIEAGKGPLELNFM
ncbi:Hypothetical predicted protein, partial [Mytilus galloprovincialis]